MEEIRALWVPRWEITDPEACAGLVETADQCGFNTLFVQVRGRGDAYYNSRLEPRAEALDGQPPDFDPLTVILDSAGRAGIEVHAWLNANLTWESETPPKSPRHIVNSHPEWLMRTVDQGITWTRESHVEGAYTCPSSEEFREFLRDVFLDVVRHYQVAGVHFDFIRYPSPRYCYCGRCLSQFAATVGEEEGSVGLTAQDGDEWDSFRRSLIDDMAYLIYDAVKQTGPRAVVSAAVFSNSADAYSQRFQDWKRWLRDGKLDLLCPMAYSESTDTFAEQITDGVESSGNISVCAGIGSWRIPVESTVEKIARAREIGAAGVCLFSYSAIGRGCDADYLKAVQAAAF